MGFLDELSEEIRLNGIDDYPPDGGLMANEIRDGAGDEVTALFESSGGPGERVQDVPGTKYAEQIVQVQCRSRSQQTARSRCYQIYNLFNGRGSENIGGTYYVSLDPLQAPFLLQRDENDRWIYAVNFTALKVPS